jgi:protein FAM50
MSGQPPSRFTPSNNTTHERLSTNTVGLVALSDFKKRRAQVLEQHEREAREAAYSSKSTPDRSLTGTPDNAGSDSGSGRNGPLMKKKKRKIGTTKLSFDDDDGDVSEDVGSNGVVSEKSRDVDSDGKESAASERKPNIQANKSIGIVPKSLTKAALRREAAEREALRREFLVIQDAVKATEIAIPFVFYDGTNIPGGMVRVKKGDYIWVFLDKSRKVGAELGVGEKANARREWARVGVDDLMLVRGTVIIPHVGFFSLNGTLSCT